MKLKGLVISFALLLVSQTVLFAQSNDINKSFNVSFTYKAMAKSGPGDTGGSPSVIKITSTSKNTVKLSIPDFVFSESFAVKAFDIDGVKISTDSNGVTTMNLDSFNTTDGNYNIKGYGVKGTFTDNKLELSIIYKAGMMPFKLTVNYKSN